MREILTQIVKHTLGVFEDIAVTGTAEKTLLQACDKDKTMFLYTETKAPIPEFEGKFAISHLQTLSNILNIPTLKNEDVVAVRQIRTHSNTKMETVVGFQFTDTHGVKSRQHTKAAELISEQATIGNVPWQVYVTPTKSKLDEFSSWVSAISQGTETVSMFTDSGDLRFTFGDSKGLGDFGMVFASGIQGELNGELHFDIAKFQRFLKLADLKTEKLSIGITTKGILGVTVETPLVEFKYYLRATKI